MLLLASAAAKHDLDRGPGQQKEEQFSKMVENPFPARAGGAGSDVDLICLERRIATLWGNKSRLGVSSPLLTAGSFPWDRRHTLSYARLCREPRPRPVYQQQQMVRRSMTFLP